jgi:hypothetical protein
MDRMEVDAAFAERVKDVGMEGGPDGALALLRAEGFEVTADEMRDALIDRYGDELTQEQLDTLAGGLNNDDAAAIIAGLGAATIGMVIVGAAAAV